MQNNRVAGGAQDYLLPALIGGAGALVAGPIGAGFAISQTGKISNTFLRNQGIKNAPDILQNAGTEIIQLLLNGYNSKSLTITELLPDDKKTIALTFHKKGYFKFFEPILKITV